MTIFTFTKGINSILNGKDTRTVQFKNQIYRNAFQMYTKRLKIKNRK
jgi:hypothetical protein